MKVQVSRVSVYRRITQMRSPAETVPAYSCLVILAVAASCLAAQPAASGDDAAGRAALAKAALNPVSSLISVPIQNNNNFITGPYNRAGDFINIQPVIPFTLGSTWNLITRTIVPVIAFQPDPISPTTWAGG
jgi:hypothetical protein